ncbi:polysaccharide export outer membrane protein [Nitrosospira multiformis ATCC 25196]|uniref:Polysaccharide export outer membrane protein n=1 Tax=Nitrosospira multiformis (strain ATCC 25196 / NCIMB 11849 / C 71) TaxID=323848 RepID=Q2YCH1_NITMU|nr:polysaccharide export protein EpsE [Nitrosospira multiformis]ABB73550.1 Polysaccharide export protein [Nitrosospira multiformis ATCC 25196]SEF81446.1 polysaccharide export outer membrane protein [Nitrosospira multiformis ATCC 25196]
MFQILVRTLILLSMLFSVKVFAESPDYPLGPGDILRIQVFQNPDLTTETRVSESGSITFPLVGALEVGGLSVASAENKLAAALKKGGFIKQPQVTIVLLQMRGSQVSVLGQVNRPGRFPLETLSRVSDMLAAAGGTTPLGDDFAIVTGTRNGQAFRKVIDIPALYLEERSDEDIILAGGDTIYVHRAPVFYIYGEAQRPGAYRIERGMTVMQALAQGGGPTPRGSEWWLRLHRRNADGVVEKLSPDMTDAVQPNDIIYVRESIF